MKTDSSIEALAPKPVILAVDPGKNGGFAWASRETVGTAPMPDSPRGVCNILCEIQPTFILIEKVGGFIAGQNCPSSAMFNFGYNFGMLEGIFTAIGCPFDEIRPQTWQKALHLGTRPKEMSKPEWKRKLKKKAEMLYPSQKVTLKNADALLILKVALNKQAGAI